MPVAAIVARAIAAAVIVFAAPVGGSAQPTLKIFDAHLHYNQIRAGFVSSCADTRYHRPIRKPVENKRSFVDSI
jgi:hypothetical protein